MAGLAVIKPRGVIRSRETTTFVVDAYSTDPDGKRVAEALRAMTGAEVDLIGNEGDKRGRNTFGFGRWDKSTWVPTGPTPPWARKPENN